MPETLEFKAELKQLLHLITHSLYSDREIFLRELISNASDAINKVRFDALANAEKLEGNTDWKIKLTPDAAAGTLTISDNGIGMSRAEVIENLGTVAQSGTKAFLEAIKNAGKVPGKDIKVVAMDLNPENVDAIKAGELLFDIGGHWLQGGFALVLMFDYLEGLPIPADQANVKLKLLPLTQDKVTTYEECFPGGVPAYNFKEHSRFYNPSAPAASFEMAYCK